MTTGDGHIAIDLWTLGTVIHEVFASDIPFLDTYHHADSEFTPNDGPKINLGLLYNYSKGTEFTTYHGRQRGFVQSLMGILLSKFQLRTS